MKMELYSVVGGGFINDTRQVELLYVDEAPSLSKKFIHSKNTTCG
jgi:hypothetical protein